MWREIAIFGAALLTGGCSGITTPTAHKASDASALPAVTASGAPGSATSSPQVGHLAGKLPVELFDPAGSGRSPVAAGFFDLSSHLFTQDPNSAMAPAGPWDLLKATASPFLYGVSTGLYGQITYDAQINRWLPVARTQVAPDGLTYAYAEWLSSSTPCPQQCMPQPIGGRIHITSLPSGRDRVVFTFTGDPVYQIVSYTGAEIFLDTTCFGGGSCDQLWRFDVRSGTLNEVVSQAGSRWRVDGTHVWMVTLGNGDVAPIYLDRIDMASGISETWLTLPARSAASPYTPDMLLIGLGADGLPWVALNSRNPAPLLRVTAPEQATQIFSADGPYSESVSNRDGTWFAVVDNASPTPTMLGLYLYTPQDGVQSLSASHLLPV